MKTWIKAFLPLVVLGSIFPLMAYLTDSIWPLVVLIGIVLFCMAVFTLAHLNDTLDTKRPRYKELKKRIFHMIDEFGPILVGAIVLFVVLGGILRSCSGNCSAEAARFNQCD